MTFILTLLMSLQVFSSEGEFVPNELIVKYKTDAKKEFNLAFPNLEIKHNFDLTNAYHVTFNSDEKMDSVIKKLLEDPNIEYVEKNYYYYLQATPNDPGLSKQYSLHNTGKTGGTVDADIDAVEAWNLTRGSRRVVVAVIDTGIHYGHPDLINNYRVNRGEDGKDSKGRSKRNNGIDDDGNGYIDDYKGWDFWSNDNDPRDENGHGTHCAGIIGARGNNGIGVAGVNWYVSMVGLKIFSRSGRTNLAVALRAIEYATKIGVDLMSNSWGGPIGVEILKEAIQRANRKGILFVAAAGNDGTNNDTKPFYPASYDVPNVISVAATNDDDRLAGFSNYGVRTVDIAAPGVNVYSTYLRKSYRSLSGTSMAAPHVAGVAALIKARYPRSSVSSLKRRVLRGDRKSSLTGRVKTGRRVNARASLR